MGEKIMTREDIIKMAREAGGIQPKLDFQPYFWRMHEADLERFATLVAAAERESLASEAEKNGNTVLAMQIHARGEK